MPDDEPVRLYALYTPQHGKKKPGRQSTSFLTYIQRLLGDSECMFQPDQITSLAQDRKRLEETCSCLLRSRQMMMMMMMTCVLRFRIKWKMLPWFRYTLLLEYTFVQFQLIHHISQKSKHMQCFTFADRNWFKDGLEQPLLNQNRGVKAKLAFTWLEQDHTGHSLPIDIITKQ